jgi:hypothetical protein
MITTLATHKNEKTIVFSPILVYVHLDEAEFFVFEFCEVGGLD